MSDQAVEAFEAMDECPRCGESHDPARCNGHRRLDGAQCHHPRGYDTDHNGFGNCKYHGGRTQNGLKHAEAEQQRAQLMLVEGAPEMVVRLRRMADRDDLPPAVLLGVIREWLDRSGVVGKQADVSVTVTVSVEERQAALIERAKALREGRVIDTTVGEDGDPR